MSLTDEPLLSADERVALAGRSDVGGGNLLAAALAINSQPDVPFIRSDRPLINTAGEEQTDFSLRQLDQLAQSWSVWYYERGVRPRDRVAIFIADSFAYMVHFCALAQLGAIPVLINSKAPQTVAWGLCQVTRPVGLYTDRAHLATLGPEVLSEEGPSWIELAEEVPAPAPAALPDRWRFLHAGEDPVSIMHSSGTTGRPKAAIQTHSSSVAGPRYRLVHFAERANQLFMTAQPQSHVGCIGYTTYAILAGRPLVALYDPSGAELAEALAAHRPQVVMAFAHAYAELAALEAADGAFDSVDHWVTMGDAIHDAHLRGILSKRSSGLPPATFFDRFGTTEMGWGLVVQSRTLSSAPSHRQVGKPDPVAEIAVLRPDGSRAAVGEVGYFGARGPTITAGYWNDAETTYRSKLGGFWLTGDLVYQAADGNLFQVDRSSDVIETEHGTGYSVLMEELILSGVTQIRDCAVVAGSHQGRIVPVAVVTTSASDTNTATLLSSANEVLNTAGHPPLAVLEVAHNDDDFPVGVTGKVLKWRLREKYSQLAEYLLRSDQSIASTISDN